MPGLVYKGFRYRAYRDEAARKTLAAWFGCDRFVDNLAIDRGGMFSRK